MGRKPALRKVIIKNCATCGVGKPIAFGLSADFDSCPHGDLLLEKYMILAGFESTSEKQKDDAIIFAKTHVCSAWKTKEQPNA